MKLTEHEIKDNSASVITETLNYLDTPTSAIHFLKSYMKDNAIHIVKDQKEMWKILWNLLEDIPQALSIYIGDTQGNMLQVRRNPQAYRVTRIVNRMDAKPYELWAYRNKNYEVMKSEYKQKLYDPRTRPWYQNTSTEDKAHYSDVYEFYSANSLGLTISWPVLDKEKNIAAVISTDILVEELNSFLEKRNISENSKSFIANMNTGVIIAYSNPSSIKTFESKENEPKKQAVNLLYLNDIKEAHIRNTAINYFDNTVKNQTWVTELTNKHLFSLIEFPNTFEKSWSLISSVPKQDRTKFLTKPVMISIMTIIIFIAGLILILNMVINKMIKPILNISNQLGDMKKFHLDDIQYIGTNYEEIHTINDAVMSLKRGLTSFAKYVNTGVVRRLIEEEENPKPGGAEKQLTVMFSDIKGFTTIAEKMPSMYLTQHLSEYFSELSSIIMDNNGTIDKYIGDAIMAFWNAPQEIENHQLIACKAIYACNKKLMKLNDKWAIDKKPLLYTRFGLHTGRAIVGNIGSNDRLNYSALGDTINISSRLESLNKDYMTSIIISEATYEHAKSDFHCRILDSVVVKGREASIKVYELVTSKEDDTEGSMEAISQAYQSAFALYTQKDFIGAYKIYKECFKQSDNTDKTSAILANKCAHLHKQALT